MPTKKTTKKAGPKKAAAKKAVAKKVSKKPASKKAALVCAKDRECFWTTDGEVLSNLVELGNALDKMADDVFKHHVTKDKNDFADWVEEVLGDRELGTALRKSKKPSTARTIVVRRLKIYDF